MSSLQRRFCLPPDLTSFASRYSELRIGHLLSFLRAMRAIAIRYLAEQTQLVSPYMLSDDYCGPPAGQTLLIVSCSVARGVCWLVA